MTPPTFSFSPDRDRRLMRISMSGFFLPPDVARFAAALAIEFALLGPGFNPHVSLIDIRGMQIQTQESVEAFGRVLASPTYAASRRGFVIEPGLARMQIKRIATTREPRYFEDVAACEA